MGSERDSGNGSLMRNSAVSVWFRNDVASAMERAYAQSRTTHRGEEAAELCRLLAYICVSLINDSGRGILDDLSDFESPLYSVMCMASASCEELHSQGALGSAVHLDDRRWDWRSPDYRYCEARAKKDPGYIGSYAMDCMAMALHCVYTTHNFTEATLKAANLRGDSDSVCAVVGQIAGALYGVSAIPEPWLERVQRWDGGTIAARAMMLHARESLGHATALNDVSCDSARLLASPWMHNSKGPSNTDEDENE